MRKALKSLLLAFITVLSLQSCLDSDYNFDNINKNVELDNVPPFVIGKIKPIKLKGIQAMLPPGDITFPPNGFAYAYYDTLPNLFNEEAIDYFFFETKKRDVKITAQLIADVMPNAAYLNVVARFTVMDSLYQKMEIQIEDQRVDYVYSGSHVTPNINQKVKFEIKKEEMHKMKNARHLSIAFYIRSQFRKEDIPDEAYVKLEDIALYAGSIAIEM